MSPLIYILRFKMPRLDHSGVGAVDPNGVALDVLADPGAADTGRIVPGLARLGIGRLHGSVRLADVVFGVCFGNGSSCATCVTNQVTSFTLMREGTAGEIGILTNGMTINK